MKIATSRTSKPSNATTKFETEYAKKVNTYWFIFLIVHLPVFLGLAAWTGSSMVVAFVVASILLAGPGVLLMQDRASSLASVAIAVSAMGMSALGIHLANGLIEAHLELFALIAMLIVFGKAAPILAAGVTIALHHVVFWLWLPSSVFNYKASFGIVLLHAFFVVLEVIPASWIAIQFGKSTRAQGIVMDQLGGSADQVTASAREISHASSRLADAAVRQASMVQETANSSEDMSVGATQNRNTSDQILVLMRSMEEQLGQANRDLSSMQHVVTGMVQSSKQISKVVKLIDGIAFQTNILSLNAAVEAASAGESGAGFSVVAKEVGNLAQKSAMAATDTAALIEHTLQSTLTGETAALALSGAMSRVTDTAAQVKIKIALLQTSCQGQERTVSQMRVAITELGTGAQETAAVAEQSSAAGACLTEQAVGLRGIVQLLQV